jgi:hypothetical protein
LSRTEQSTVCSVLTFDIIYDASNTRTKYSIIYADPPWSYKCWSKKSTRTADSHYDVMTLNDIKALPVSDIANDNAVLFMWITLPLLAQSFEVIKAWGFTYKTNGFTWVKRNKIKTDKQLIIDMAKDNKHLGCRKLHGYLKYLVYISCRAIFTAYLPVC